mmetsp:Transcript_18849/g.13676  ORF Transcript_18849/g.13676 Transcript_18849/m.13676 type:complete len:92 (+) Transcript_18849:1400-1675(+)
MVRKENELMAEVDGKVAELEQRREGWRKHCQELKDEREVLRRELEKCRKEIENLVELVKLKDTQIEAQQYEDDKDRESIEKFQKENKDLRT